MLIMRIIGRIDLVRSGSFKEERTFVEDPKISTDAQVPHPLSN